MDLHKSQETLLPTYSFLMPVSNPPLRQTAVSCCPSVFRVDCLSVVRLDRHTLPPSLALLIFATLGIAQTSLALHSLCAKIWFACRLVRLGKCEAFTNTFKNKQTVSNCVALKRWHGYSSLLSSSSIASLNQWNILDITNFPNPASVSILAKKLMLASPFSINAFSMLSFSFIRLTSSIFFA